MADQSTGTFSGWPADDSEFSRRVAQYLESGLSAEELKQFNDELRADESKRNAFSALCLTRAGLIEQLIEQAEFRKADDAAKLDQARSLTGGPPDLNDVVVAPALILEDEPEPDSHGLPLVGPSAMTPASLPRRKWKTLAIAAAILLPITATGLIRLMTGSMSNPSAVTVSIGDTVLNRSAVPQHPESTQCRLAVAIDAVWTMPEDASLAAPNEISTGPHSLKAGTIQLNLGTGVKVAIEAPAEFDILSDSKLELTRGKICAAVDHGGTGLTVATPDMTAVDLGTEFAMDVTAINGSHLEVLKGSVRAETSPATGDTVAQTLSANQAVLVMPASGRIQADISRPLSFVRPAELSNISSAGQSAYQRWKSFSQTLCHDPALTAYYTFDNQSEAPQKLINRAISTAGANDGTMGDSAGDAAPVWTKGRWPEKSALEFGQNKASAVTIQGDRGVIPENAITLGVWLKRTEVTKPVHLINGNENIDTAFNLSLLGTAGKPAMRLSPSVAYFTWATKDVRSTPSLPDASRWYFLTVTAQASGGTQFYLNGQLFSSVMNAPGKVRPVQTLVLGRSVPENRGADPRDIFHGIVDELMIFDRTLSPEEIAHIYAAGKPE